MKSSNQEKLISHLKEKIHELREYLVSDCCRQCLGIIKTIEEYQNDINRLQMDLEEKVDANT
jgi:hypothetical protein